MLEPAAVRYYRLQEVDAAPLRWPFVHGMAGIWMQVRNMLVTIEHFFDPWEAHILRARLEADGIPALVVNDQHIMACWPLSMALGGAALQVQEEDAPKAREIVSAYQSGALQEDLIAEHPEAADSCPVCGSRDMESSVPLAQSALAIATFMLASAPFPTNASQRQCKACGHAWRSDEVEKVSLLKA